MAPRVAPGGRKGSSSFQTASTLTLILLTLSHSVSALNSASSPWNASPANRTGTIAVVSKASNSVSLVDVASFSVVHQAQVGRPGHRAGPHEVGVYPFGGKTLLITHYEEVPDAERGASVTLMDLETQRQAILFLGKGTRGPHGVVCVSATFCVVSVEFSRHLAIVDVAAQRVVSLIDTAPFELHEVTAAIAPPSSTAAAADGLESLPRYAIGSDRTHDAVVTVDLRAGRMVEHFRSTGSEPEGIAHVPLLLGSAALGGLQEQQQRGAKRAQLAWTANRKSDTIDVVEFSPDGRGVVDSFALGDQCRFPIRVGASLDRGVGRSGAAGEAGTVVFVSCMESATVLAFDAESRAQIGSVALRGAGGQQPANPSGIISIGGGLVVFTDGGVNASQPDEEHGIVVVDFARQREVRRLSGGFLVPDGLAFTTAAVVGEAARA